MAPSAPAPPAPKFDPREITGLKLWLDADQAPVMGRDPKSVPGLQLWLKADAITGLADGDSVSTWADQSGQGRDATQATGANKPLYKTGIVNGRPVVRFDGSNDFLAGTLSAYTAHTAFLVFQTTVSSPEGENGVINLGTTQATQQGITMVTDNTIYSYYGGGAINITASFALNTWVIASRMWTGGPLAADMDFFKNGAAQTSKSGTPTGDVLDAAYVLGERNKITSVGYWGGDIAEVIIYNRALSQVERTGVEKYLADKYALSAGGAPYADNDAVQMWQDLSGNGNHAVQATASKKPLHKINIQAGRPIVRFDGTDDRLTVANESQFDIAEPTIFVVAIPDIGTSRVCFSKSGADPLDQISGYEFDFGGWVSGEVGFLCLTDGSNLAARKATFSTGTAIILTGQFDSSKTGNQKVRLWKNGAEQSDFAVQVGTVTTITQNDLVTSAGSNAAATPAAYFDGDIAEILVFSSALGDQDRKTVERYLATKWGIAYSG